MNRKEFTDSLELNTCPANMDDLLKVLWYIKKDNWEEAHNLADGMPGSIAEWLHALLHRIEGDKWNANYWYKRAGREYPEISTDNEWEVIFSKCID